jgi:drug/metabolite transporter (DMT)-like permease
MNWIPVALGVIISSAAMYLCIRKAKSDKIEIEAQNLAMFLIPMLIYFVFNLAAGISFAISWQHLLIILGAAIFFSWLGNVWSLKALNTAPNPGYSLIISKSYVILTTLLATIFFGSEITVKNVIAILIVIAFSALIIVDKNRQKGGKISWLIYTLGAFFAWAFLALTLTYLTNQGLQSLQITFYLMLFASLVIVAEMIFKKVKLGLNKKRLGVMLGIGIAGAVFNFCLVFGYQIAPNPGYINAANAASIALLTVLYHVIFKDPLPKAKVVGIIGIGGGLIILFI